MIEKVDDLLLSFFPSVMPRKMSVFFTYRYICKHFYTNNY